MKLLDGKKLATETRERVKKEIESQKLRPGLAVILVGDDPASHLYVALKERAAMEVGIIFQKYYFPAPTIKREIIEKIKDLNHNPEVHGIIVQLPLPNPADENDVVAAIDPKKDVDGFHEANLLALDSGAPNIRPVLAKVAMRLVEESGISTNGKQAVIVANNPLFFRPFNALLAQAGATVKGVLATDPKLSDETREADILIVAIGKPKSITKDMVKEGAVVIDIGTTRVDGKTVGDVDFENVQSKVLAITPVPGGVGPMTVATLLENTLEATRRASSPELRAQK